MTTATALNLPQPEQYAPQNPAAIESVHIRGFRSLADVQLVDLPKATVLIGANGSGKSNIIRFFEMGQLDAPLPSPRRVRGTNGGGDDQLFGGSRITSRIEAEISLRADRGRNDYRFTSPMPTPTASSLPRKLSGSATLRGTPKRRGNISTAATGRRKLLKRRNRLNTPALTRRRHG